AMIANCGYLTGGINMIPDAVIDDGLLDVALLDPRHLVDWIQVASATLTAKRKSPRVTTFQARTCRMVFEEPLVAQIDGDPIPKIKEVKVTTIPLSLRARVPVELSTEQKCLTGRGCFAPKPGRAGRRRRWYTPEWHTGCARLAA